MPQKNLDDIQRQNNLKKAFKILRNDVKLNTIVIIDDIYTTGSTIDMLTATLHAAGIKNVFFCSIGNRAWTMKWRAYIWMYEIVKMWENV